MTLYLADLDPRYCTIREIDKLGCNAVDSNEIFIDERPVPLADRVGYEGKGFQYLLDDLNPERVLIGHEALGIGRVAIERAVTYANQRVVLSTDRGEPRSRVSAGYRTSSDRCSSSPRSQGGLVIRCQPALRSSGKSG